MLRCYRRNLAARRTSGERSSRVFLKSFHGSDAILAYAAAMKTPEYRTTFAFVAIMLAGIVVGWILVLDLFLRRY